MPQRPQKKPESQRSPGPGAYQVRATEQPLLPSGKFATSNRQDFLSSAASPGPGQYDIPSSIKVASPQKRRRLHRDKPRSEKPESMTPGPGSYNPRPQPGPNNAFIGNRLNDVPSLTAKTPEVGPGHYSPNYAAVHPTTGCVMGTGARSELHATDNGGRLYNISPEPSGPKYSFAHSQRTTPVKHTVSPPPGQYNVVGFTDDLRHKGKTMSSRPQGATQVSATPGPGAYYTPQVVRTSPGFSIGQAARRALNTHTNEGGPAKYSPNRIDQTSKSCTFAKSTRPSIARADRNPGPGAYDLSPEKATAYSILGRKAESKNKEETPGPGTYKTNSSLVQSRGPRIGNSQRSEPTTQGTKLNPGPGHYSLVAPRVTTGWTFGRGLREKDILDDEPGPGAYEVPASVPDVPKYLMGSNQPPF